MNRNLAAAVALGIACAASGAAFADDITVEPYPFVPSLSRAQVKEELAQFRTSGVNWMADDYNPLNQFQSSRSRADVRAEYLASRDAVAALYAEDSGSNYLARSRVVHPRSTQFARAK